MEDFDVRAAVLLGNTGAVVWDTLAHPAQMAPVSDLVGGRSTTVVYSHADWDHAWGTSGLGRVEQVVAHEAALRRFATDVADELAVRQASDDRVWDAVRLVPPTRTFVEDLTLDLGGLTLELHALPGHTVDSIVGLVPERGVLFAGDAVETPLPFVNDAAAVAGWGRALEGWLDDARVETVIPSHGPVGGPDLLRRTAGYLRTISVERELALPGDLTPFYRETHERNVRLMRTLGS